MLKVPRQINDKTGIQTQVCVTLKPNLLTTVLAAWSSITAMIFHQHLEQHCACLVDGTVGVKSEQKGEGREPRGTACLPHLRH